MANSERGGRILGIGAPPRERTAPPVLPRPDVRTVPVSPEQGKPPKKKREKRIGRKARIALAGLAVLGAGEITGAVIAEKTNNQPLSTRTIPADLAWPWNLGKSAVEDIQGLFKGKTSSPEASVFDPTATSGVIKPSMIERLPQEEIAKLDPFTKIDDRNTIQVLYPIDVSTSKNPNVSIEYKKSLNISKTTGNQSHLEQQGFYNAFYSKNIPSGTIIYAPVDGKLILYTDSGNIPPINDRDYSTATIDFQVNGKDYRMIITGGKKNRGDIFNTLTNAPVIGSSKMSREEVAKINNQAISIKRGNPILQVAEDKIDFKFWIRGDFDQSKAYKGLLNGQEVIFVPETPTNLDFFSTPNGGLVRLQK